ncbi:hypothetical protein BURPS305_2944 [Burkholderia pseudomallei 305]|nr:hypothetical protein BURPS305_2944 [Burkholderia pseudomallei 305]KGS22897.1 hypothetical protein X962_5178 [Burkholderia pseudomallei MSHR7343]
MRHAARALCMDRVSHNADDLERVSLEPGICDDYATFQAASLAPMLQSKAG